MPRIAASNKVVASPEMVFRIIEMPPEPILPKGGPVLRRLGEGGVGAIYRWEFRRLGLGMRTDSVVTEYDPGRKIAFAGISGWSMEAEATLHPEPDGTRIQFLIRYRFPAPVRWLIPGPLIRLGIWHAMNRIKAMAETGTTGVGGISNPM